MTAENSKWSSPPLIARTLGRWALSAVAALLVLLIAVLGLLQIGPIRQSITDYALKTINQGDTHVAIGELGGAWPYRLHLADLTVADANGVWLKLDSADLRWSPFALLVGQLHIVDFTAEGLTVSRAPESTTPSTDDSATSFALPSSPLAIKLDAAHITGIKLGRGLIAKDASGVLAELDLDTQLQIARNASEISLHITRTDKVPGDINLKALVDPAAKHIALTLNARDGDANHKGLIAELAGLGDGPLLVTAKVDGVDGDLAGQVNVDGGRNFTLATSAKGEWTRDLTIALDANASGRMIANALAGAGGAKALALKANFQWNHNDNISLSDLAIDAGALTVSGKAQLGSVTGKGSHAFTSGGEVKGLDAILDHKGNAALAALQWQIKSRVDLGKGMANVDLLKISSPAGDVSYKGNLALDGSTAKGAIEGKIADLAPLGALAGQPMTGSGDLALTPFIKQANGDIAGDFVIHTKDVKADNPVLTSLFNDITADGSLLIPGDGGFALPAFSVRSMDGAYAFKGNVASSASGILSGETHVTSENVADLLKDGSAAGQLKADASLGGTIDAPEITLAAALSNGQIAQVKTNRLSLNVKAITGGTGPVAIEFKGAPGTARIDAQLTLQRDGGARLAGIDGKIFGSQLSGDVGIDKASLITAELEGKHVVLAPLASLAGASLDGIGNLSIKAQPIEGRQSINAAFEAPSLTASGIDLHRVALRANLADLFGEAALDASLTAQSGQLQLVHLDKLEAKAKGPLDKLALDFDAHGQNETTSPKEVSLNASATIRGGVQSALDIASLKLAMGDAQMSLARPTTIGLTQGITARDLQFDMTGASGPGSVRGDLDIASSARLNFQLKQIPLDLLSLAMPVDAVHGSADGDLSLDTVRGQGKLALTFDQIQIAQDIAHENPAFDATLLGNWSGKRLKLTATAQGVSSEPFVLEASLPFVRYAGSAFPTLAKRGATSASLDWDGPLASLTALADLSGQRFSGDAHVALKASGDISAPVVSGEATLTNGSYENFASGTLLQDLNLKLEGQRSQSLAFDMTATDGGAGKISANGQISLDKHASPAIAISTQISNARLLHRKDVDATLDGTLELTGPVFPPSLEKPALLNGTITSKAMHIQIPESLPVDVPLVDVTEINGDGSEPVSRIVTAKPIPLMLDIAFNTETPARISGRGLDSLWSGKLAVTGRADQPLIKGQMTSDRGTLDFIGKTFTLNKGSVTFPGTYPTEPQFYVELSYARTDFKAKISVSGDPSKPTIAFSSTPSLPEDEILSRILFDKKVGELTPMEALQLARALADMSGTSIGGSGGGIMNRLQESLSLDVLRIDSSPSGATTVSAGKYIQKGVYVGVEQGALASDSSVKVEIDVTPQISVDTRVGQNASSDIGVNWKWDY